MNDTMESIEITIPPLDEQNKISKFLTLLDKEILIIDNYIKETEQFKKSIMQEIFN